MAYVSKEMKAQIVKNAKPLMKKHNIKGTFSIDNNSTIVLKITSSPYTFGLDEDTTYRTVNHYHIENANQYTKEEKSFLIDMLRIMKTPEYFNDSDITTDYFSCSHYIDIKIGTWDKPYQKI